MPFYGYKEVSLKSIREKIELAKESKVVARKIEELEFRRWKRERKKEEDESLGVVGEQGVVSRSLRKGGGAGLVGRRASESG